MINATNDAQPRELIPAGNHVARCYEMIHVGTNKEVIMGDEKILNKIRLTFELPQELRVFNEEKGEQPMVISKEYTLSMHEKSNLRKDLESWRGQGFTEDEAKSFDVTKLLGVPCLLNIIHKTSQKGSKYTYISNVTTLIKGMDCPKQVNETFEFNFTDHFDSQVVEKFPDFIKDKIKTSSEYRHCIELLANEHEDKVSQDLETDDLPF